MARIDANRRRAFLTGLAQTGNIELACERAKVSKSWVTRGRRDDPEFRAQVEAATAQARERLRALATNQPTSHWRTQDGHELVVQHGHGRFVQVRRARRKQWTPRTEARFLEALSQSCNVTLAVHAADTTAAAAYRHRLQWPDFAQRWDEALQDGYDRISTLIVANAGKMLGDPDMIPEIELPGMTVAAALQALQLYRKQLHGSGNGGRTRGWWRRPRTLDEVKHSILTKLECIVRADEVEIAEDVAREG